MPTALPLAPPRPTPADAGPPGDPLDVVLVDEELPYPPTSGKRIRSLSLTLRLARRHRLTYLCHRNADAEEARTAAEYFADQGIRTVVVPRAVPAKSGPLFPARLAANLLSSLPYSVATHNSRALRRALREHAARHRVDLWHCEWTPYAKALEAVAGPRLVIAHNVESVIWQRYQETAEHPLERWYIGRQARKFERFEKWALNRADCTVAVSAVDARHFRTQLGVEHVAVVDNGVNTRYFVPREEFRDPAKVLFLGSLDWRPNLDGARLLLDRVFPAVRAAEPSATLCLVGRNPPTWLRRQAAARPGVELHANVPDVRPYLAGCGLMVVPLRVGGGSRLKILEALASGTPVVSTRIGAEGLRLDPGQHLSVVEEIENLPATLLESIRRPQEARERAEQGRRRVVAEYDWDRLAGQLEHVWMAVARGKAGSRKG